MTRMFDSGANRDTSNGKADYSWMNPAVEQSTSFYMMKHSKLHDGTYRPMNNWWKGIPFPEGLKSLERHVMDTKHIVGGGFVYKERLEIDGESYEYTHYLDQKIEAPPNWSLVSLEDALQGIKFNANVCILATIISKQN